MPNSATNKLTFHSTRLGDVVAHATKCLETTGASTPSLDARWLIGETLHLDRTQLFLQADRSLTPIEIEQITALIEKRTNHVPVARILGEREFWGLPFGLNNATLEPRPDSETLIEATLRHRGERQVPLRIIDLGTGTGCLLLALLHEFPNATGLGIDSAPQAVQQAEINAARLNLTERANFIVSNWLDGIEELFDIIISNPPYIATDVIPTLMLEVRDHDPYKALDGGSDGLTPYRHLIPQLHRYLKPGGLAVFEVGYDQASFVHDCMEAHNLSPVTVIKDLGGLARCVVGLKSA